MNAGDDKTPAEPDTQNGNSYTPYGYDPMTGLPNPAPISPDTGNGLNEDAPFGYDPMTGRPKAPYGYDPRTGKPAGRRDAVLDDVPDTGRQGNGRQFPGSDGGKNNGGHFRKGRGPLIWVLAVLGVAVLAAAVFAGVYFGLCFLGREDASEETSGDVFANTAQAVLSHNKIGNFICGLSDTDTIGLRYHYDSLYDFFSELTGETNDQLAQLLDNEAVAELALSANKGEAALSSEVQIGETVYQAQLYADEDRILMTVPELTDGVYEVNMENFGSDLAASVFNPESGSAFALNHSDFVQLMQLAQAYGDITEAAEKAGGAGLYADFRDALSQEGLMPEFVEAGDLVSVGGEEVSCTMYAAELSADELVSLISFTESYIRSSWPLLAENNGEVTGLLSALNELEEEITSTDATLTLSYAVKDRYVIYYSADYAAEDSLLDAVRMEIDFGANPAKSDQYRMSMTAGGEQAELIYHIIQNDENGYAMELTASLPVVSSSSSSAAFSSGSSAQVSVVDELFPVCAFSWEEESGEFTFTILDNVWITGRLMLTGNQLTLSNMSLTAPSSFSGSSVINLAGLSITLDSAAEIERPAGNAVNLLAMSEDELTELVSEMQSRVFSTITTFR